MDKKKETVDEKEMNRNTGLALFSVDSWDSCLATLLVCYDLVEKKDVSKNKVG